MLSTQNNNNKSSNTESHEQLTAGAAQGEATAQLYLGWSYANCCYEYGRGVAKDEKEAVRWIRLAAEQGHAQAQFNLGVKYENGRCVAKDEKEAVRWYRLAAEQGHAQAQNNLGVMVENGRGVAKDEKEAVRLYRLAAEQGHVKAQFNLGAKYANGRGVAKDAKEAVRWYRLAVEQGHAQAQYNLGWMVEYGRGVAKDEKEAIRWYRLAAEQGYAQAQFVIGSLYNKGGAGLAKDAKEAVRWYRLAADHGNANAQFNLGNMYRSGRGVAKDEKEAVRWYRLAAEQGHVKAQCNLGWMVEYGRGVAKDEKEAVRWYRLAAEQGHVKAQCNLGERYEQGRGLAKDEKEAVRWYRLAAERGHANAQCNLGLRYDVGRGVAKDEKEAIRWYRLAAEQGNAQAQCNLGERYEQGRGVAKDEKEAVRWCRLSAEQRLALAQYRLGANYANGIGVAKDEKEAVRWYRLAAEQGDAQAQCKLGVMVVNGRGVAKDEQEAVRWCRLVAKQGNAKAQYKLGVNYANGCGVAKDEKESVRLYRLAAEQGHAQAQCNLGLKYANGCGVAKDSKEAVRWYRLAAEQGNADAQSSLEKMVGFDRGMVNDEKEIYVRNSTMVRNERALSGHMKKCIKEEKGGHDKKSQDRRRAVLDLCKEEKIDQGFVNQVVLKQYGKYRRLLSSDSEDPSAHFILGAFNASPHYGIEDKVKAEKYLKRAIALGHPKAAHYLADLWYDDTLEEKGVVDRYLLKLDAVSLGGVSASFGLKEIFRVRDNNEAFRSELRSQYNALKNKKKKLTSDDLHRLGFLSYIVNSRSVENGDFSESLDCYKKASSKKYAPSFFALANLYDADVANGFGKKDMKKAMEYYEEAANLGHMQAQLILAKNEDKKGKTSRAINWCEKAVTQGNSDAMALLGDFLLRDRFHIKEHFSDIADLYLLSAVLGNKDSYEKLGRLYTNTLGFLNDKKAYTFHVLSIKNRPFSTNQSIYQLGIAYFKGQYVEKNDTRACQYFALSDGETAKPIKAFFYEEGHHVAQDIQKAIILYMELADSNLFCAYRLALIYEQGKDNLIADKEEAFNWYQHVATLAEKSISRKENNLSAPYYWLGLLYRDGKGGKIKDETRAYQCFQKAITYDSYYYEEINEQLSALESKLHVQIQTEGVDPGKQAFEPIYPSLCQPSEKQVLRTDEGSEILFNPSEEGQGIDTEPPLKAFQGFNLVPSAPQPSPSAPDADEEGEQACASCCMIQ